MKALIIGVTGGIGGETARVLLSRGWSVRAVHRDPERAATSSDVAGLEWVRGDAMNRDEIDAAARGVDVIVHAANPPGYRNWKGFALPMLENAIAAAQAANARIVFPGTVYNFGPDAFPHLSESSPQQPRTRKGKIRVAMEQRLEEAARAGVRVLIVRAGDFFGPRAANSWFSQGLVKPNSPLAKVTYPGAHDAGHAWAYLPDLAETIARLVERAGDLQPFDVFHFGGHWFERGVELAEATREAARADVRIAGFPWFAVYLAAPFNETLREMVEMRYLWKTAVRLDNAKLVAFLGEEPHTPLDVALRVTLRGLGIEAAHPHGRSARTSSTAGT